MLCFLACSGGMSDEVLLKSVSFTVHNHPLKVYLDNATPVSEEQLRLAHFIEEHVSNGQMQLRDKALAQLWCGLSGLPGIVASLCGAHAVLADIELSPTLRFNADENLPIKRSYCIPASLAESSGRVAVGTIRVVQQARKKLRECCGSDGFDFVVVAIEGGDSGTAKLTALVRCHTRV